MGDEVTSRQSKFALMCVGFALFPSAAILSYACWKAAWRHPENLLSVAQVAGGVIFGLLAFQLFNTGLWAARVSLREYEETVGWSSRREERNFAHYMRKLTMKHGGMIEDIREANRKKFLGWTDANR